MTQYMRNDTKPTLILTPDGAVVKLNYCEAYMQKSDFWYDLPEKFIAQTPIEDRSQSKMLVLDRDSGECTDRHFSDITDYLREGDCLVLNNTKVIPARIYGKRPGTQGKIEFLLLRETSADVWEVLAKPGRKVTAGEQVAFDGGLLADVLEVLPNGNRVVRFTHEGGSLLEILNRIGEMPLPHYIHTHLDDPDRYQTVYCKEPGSVAAPTAGLHFTPQLLKTLADRGVAITYLTLHVGVGTFRPVKENDITKHEMHTEFYILPHSAADAINAAKARGGRVIAVGTTSCRTLEAVYGKYGSVVADSGFTDIFIYPPYKFGVIDGLITNFHLPESTLIMLVSAFAGREHTLAAYEHAKRHDYRFYSFGDACLIL